MHLGSGGILSATAAAPCVKGFASSQMFDQCSHALLEVIADATDPLLLGVLLFLNQLHLLFSFRCLISRSIPSSVALALSLVGTAVVVALRTGTMFPKFPPPCAFDL